MSSSATPDAASQGQPTATTTQDATPKQAPAPSQAKHKPFPSVSGGCICNKIRYRLLTSPLFVYACHCPDCQRNTGSAFGLFVNIETYNIQITTPTQPVLHSQLKRPGMVHRCYVCPDCRIELWSNNSLGESIADVRVGTLDYPGLMEPDMHSFVESKVDWLVLPPHAKTAHRGFKHRDFWPKSSLKRLDICLERVAQAAKKRAEKKLSGEGVDGGDGEKTPTAVEFEKDGEEDDEAFEKRYKETERALQERLEKLRVKLEDEGGKEDAELEKLTKNLEIADSKSEKDEEGAKGDSLSVELKSQVSSN